MIKQKTNTKNLELKKVELEAKLQQAYFSLIIPIVGLLWGYMSTFFVPMWFWFFLFIAFIIAIKIIMGELEEVKMELVKKSK